MQTTPPFTSVPLAIALTLATPAVQGSPDDYRIVSRGRNHAVWQRISTITNLLGRAVFQTNSYTELATGLNYRDAITREWLPSVPEFEILPDRSGAVARRGPYKAFAPADIYTGALELVTSEGRQLRSRPLGISYFDGTNSVLIAELTNSVGRLLPSKNKIIWTNCFTDFAADLVAEYKKSGFSCSIIFRERPPGPEAWGLPDHSRLQIITEFFGTRDPVQIPGKINTKDGLRDSTLRFGTNMAMVPGRAFSIANDTDQLPQSPKATVPVYKTWERLPDPIQTNTMRTLLIEQVPYQRIKDRLNMLAADSAPRSGLASLRPGRHKPTAGLLLPAQRGTAGSHGTILIANSDAIASPGYVIDWETVDSGGQETYTFQKGSTYKISGIVEFADHVTLEGGAVLKYASDQSSSLRAGAYVFQTSMYHPAILTSVCDNTVGETIETGTPQLSGPYLYCLSGVNLTNVQIRYAACGTVDDSSSAIWDSQFVHCATALFSLKPTLHNVLFADCDVAVADGTGGSGETRIVEHVTADNCAVFVDGGDSSTPYFIRNSILRGVSTVNQPFGGSPTITGDHLIVAPAGARLFTAVAAGNYYLANHSEYRNCGTASLTPAMLSDLRNRTTFPPISLTSAMLSPGSPLVPQAQRDTDRPDLGFHYAPVDHYLENVQLQNTQLRINPGTVLAYACGPGFVLQGGAQISCAGSATSMVTFVPYAAAQEQPIKLGSWTAGMPVYNYRNGGSSAPASFEFSRFLPALGAGATTFWLYTWGGWAYSRLSVADCQFSGGIISLDFSADVDFSFQNNLFQYSNISASEYYGGHCTFEFRNNLVKGGNLYAERYGSGEWVIKDNAFDSAEVLDAGEPPCDRGHNAFINTSRTGMAGPNDIQQVLNPNYENGPLGSFYYRLDGPSSLADLVNAGSRSANDAGLAHYTVRADQFKEATTVDIGFHYVALANGTPADSDQDTCADYLEDTNGDFDGSNDPTSWLLYNSPNALASPNGLQVFSPLK